MPAHDRRCGRPGEGETASAPRSPAATSISLVVDEETALAVLEGMEGLRHVAMKMRTRPIGRSGIEASVVGLGTWAIGGWMWGGTDEAPVDRGDPGLDRRGRQPDRHRARLRQGAAAEEIVGKAIRGRRDKVVLATKCGLVWHTAKGNHFFDYDGQPVHRYLGADSIRL